jgi:hypothetical protein
MIPAALPNPPENQEDRALKWAAIFAGPVMSVAQGYFGYRLGVTQSNNTANSTIASYNALSATSVAGFNANRDIANSGFNSNSSIAGNGFYTAATIANGGFATIGDIVQSVSRPNITVTNGVIGRGSYTGPNSGANSGNSGRINSDDNTTTRNCSGPTTDNNTDSGNPRNC